MLSSAPPTQVAHRPWRGVYFNPQFEKDPNFAWLLYYPGYRDRVRKALRELKVRGDINLVDIFVLIPNTLKTPAQGNRSGEAIEEWANLDFLKNVSQFVDDCHDASIDVELDLVDNRWIPQSIDSDQHIGKPGNPWWPTAAEEPENYKAAAEWYAAVIGYVEAHAQHANSVACWSMMGNYHWGAAEPVLWENADHPEILRATERFVKAVWPSFCRAGRRPKASPILLPIFADSGYWKSRGPSERLSGFLNLHKWLALDLKMEPDYWVMSTYPGCNPAKDGVYYLDQIIKILGPGSAARLISTDLKSVGHNSEREHTILSLPDVDEAAMLRWQLGACNRHGFAGWWIWAYQDTPESKSGIRKLSGDWKPEVVKIIRDNASSRR